MSPVKSIVPTAVGVVVNVGGLKTSLAAIFASPSRLWADQPNAVRSEL